MGVPGSGWAVKPPVGLSTVYRRRVRRTGGFVFVTGSSQSPCVHGVGVGTGVGVGVGAGVGVAVGVGLGVGVTGLLPPQAANEAARRRVAPSVVLFKSFSLP
jgi:hypothetical protein